MSEITTMQTGQEFAITANIAAIIVSALVAVYLLRLWYRQENRIYTDLPLMFGITFASMAMNALIQTLTLTEIVPATMDVFRIRALVISGSAFPLLGALLNIWLPRIQKYHVHIMASLIAYWVLISIIGPSESFVMTLLIPLLLVFTVGMMITFAITWRTGRLKEVRSDLMILTLLIGFLSQIMRVPMTAIGLDFIPISIAAMSAVIGGLALANPWYHQKQAQTTPELVEVGVYE